ncbi:iron complex transport system permease protein [Devosia sp. YR412]|uniref:FecCD family ABC transporter permease n=1 Tax=Devosia sp. YR412 TaxID=1881030 RepID=UPI0008AB2BFD|nr:iron chelate uptake ABC transporter family permease subunit [Devosia sp. YR412]SEP64604.1 iron complex transport system permease protein [Devosia sp. YR412]
MSERPSFPARPVFRPWRGVALPYQPRSLALLAIATAIGLVLAVITLLTGGFSISPLEVWTTLWGGSDQVSTLVVVGLRLPRIVACVLVGAALGVSGGVFQGLSRNPLASPDIIGFTSGAATGVLVLLLVEGAGATMGLSAGAMLGGFGTAFVVYLLALRRGVHGQRLILVGIGVGAMLSAFNAYLITRAELEAAQTARIWLHGSLNGIGWAQVGPLAMWCIVLLPLALLLAPRLKLLEMGDDLAKGLGLPSNRAKLQLIVVSVGLAAAAIAAAGPIGFVALAAPQLAQRLARTGGIDLLGAAAMGAVLMLAADLAAQRLLAPFQIPVGLVTGAMGGAYLIYLLAREWRKTD